MEYKTKQIGFVIIGLCLAVIIGLSIFVVTLSSNDPTSLPAIYTMILAFIIIIILFGQLETTVFKDRIVIKFGVGLVKKTILLKDIKSVKKVKSTFMHGWGIRYTPYGWLWNISGYEAVEIEFKSERKNFRIGCKSHGELQAAIKKRL